MLPAHHTRVGDTATALAELKQTLKRNHNELLCRRLHVIGQESCLYGGNNEGDRGFVRCHSSAGPPRPLFWAPPCVWARPLLCCWSLCCCRCHHVSRRSLFLQTFPNVSLPSAPGPLRTCAKIVSFMTRPRTQAQPKGGDRKETCPIFSVEVNVV